MADHAVYKIRKDDNDVIVALGGGCGEMWTKQEGIRDLESGAHTYFVPWTIGRTEI